MCRRSANWYESRSESWKYSTGSPQRNLCSSKMPILTIYIVIVIFRYKSITSLDIFQRLLPTQTSFQWSERCLTEMLNHLRRRSCVVLPVSCSAETYSARQPLYARQTFILFSETCQRMPSRNFSFGCAQRSLERRSWCTIRCPSCSGAKIILPRFCDRAHREKKRWMRKVSSCCSYINSMSALSP